MPAARPPGRLGLFSTGFRKEPYSLTRRSRILLSRHVAAVSRLEATGLSAHAASTMNGPCSPAFLRDADRVLATVAKQSDMHVDMLKISVSDLSTIWKARRSLSPRFSNSPRLSGRAVRRRPAFKAFLMRL
jgi:hypothetical protein